MTLSKEQIANLTRKAELAEQRGSHKSRWLTAGDAEQLHKAIKAGNTRVVLSCGQFVIKPDAHGTAWFVKPATGPMVPCGWYTESLLQSIASTD